MKRWSMVRRCLGIMALVLLFVLMGHGWAQTPITLTLHTAQSANTSGASAPTGIYDDAIFVVTGSFTGNVNFQVVTAGGQVQALQCRQQGTGALVTQGTIADTYECLLPGGTTIQAPTTGMTSGSVTVTLQLTFASRQRFGQLLLGTSVKPTLNNCLVGNGTTWGSATCGPSTGVTGPVKDKGGAVYNVSAYGAVCDGVTDDSAAVTATITAANAAGGGTILFPPATCLINSQILLPNSGGSSPTQKTFRLTGGGPSHSGRGTAPNGGTILLLAYSGSDAKILTLGGGYLEIDGLTLQETSASTTTPFVLTTLTTVHIHDVEFFGHTSKSTTACNQDAIILGGTGTVINGNSGDPFQGYGTVIEKNYFNRIRRMIYCRTFCNGNVFSNNTNWNSSGTNITTAITAATNANPAVLTVTGHGFPSTIGATINLNFSGFTGNWTPLNGQHVITYVSANTFSVAVDSTTFGALTGTPVYPSGAAIELLGVSGNATTGNTLVGNLIEMDGYPIAFLNTLAIRNSFISNNIFDGTVKVFANYRFIGGNAQFNTVFDGYKNDSFGVLCLDDSASNTCYTSGQSQATIITQPWQFQNAPQMTGTANPTGPQWVDLNNNIYQFQFQNPQQLNLLYTPNGGGNEGTISIVRTSLAEKRILIGDGNITDARIIANTGAANLELESGASGGSVFLGDTSSQKWYVNSGMLQCTNTTFPSMRFANTGGASWSSTTSPSGANDVGIARHAAGVLEANNGTQGSFNGDFGARGLGVGTAPNGQNVIAFLNFVFANIGTVLTANGQIGYCSDCTIANPCAGSGTGAIAKRLNGVNVCN